jgi:hypothetical protein
MDPYLEQPDLWSDFHGNLAPEIQARLNPLIQPRYFARLTPYVTYEEIEIGATRGIRPDVAVWSRSSTPSPSAAGAATLTPAPVESAVPLEVPLVLNRVEIRSVGDQQLVTVIEVLSPVNKRPGHEAYHEYRRKRRDLLRTAVNLVEIDLLRAGERPPLETPVPAAPYYVVLARGNRRPRVEVWPIPLTAPLPTVPIPLLEPDGDALLDLGAAFRAIYDRCAYASQINYAQPPPPPRLTPEETRWLDELLHHA